MIGEKICVFLRAFIYPSIHPSIHPYTYIRVSYFRFCAKRRGIVPNVFDRPSCFHAEKTNPFLENFNILLFLAERRSFPVFESVFFAMCFVPVSAVMKRCRFGELFSRPE